MNRKKEKEKYKVIGTKVSPWAFEIFERTARKTGMTMYEVVQMMIDTFVRYASDRHNLTPEMEEAMEVFEHTIGWRDALNWADPSADPRIGEAIYFLEQEGKDGPDGKDKKKGVRAVLVKRPICGRGEQTVNIQEIVDRAMELIVPERYRKLNLIAEEMKCKSIIELLDRIIDRNILNDVNAVEIRKEFEDCYRAENNKPLAYGERTRRKKHRSVDDVNRQMAIPFEAEDFQEIMEKGVNEKKGDDA